MADAPDCSPDGPVNLADDEQQPTEEVGVVGGESPCVPRARRIEAGSHRAQQPTEEVGVVGDTNLGVVMLALLVMGLINYSMRDPCTC